MSEGGGSKPGEQRLVSFRLSLAEKFGPDNDLAARSVALSERLRNPIKFRLPNNAVGRCSVLRAADSSRLLPETRAALLLRFAVRSANRAQCLDYGGDGKSNKRYGDCWMRTKVDCIHSADHTENSNDPAE